MPSPKVFFPKRLLRIAPFILVSIGILFRLSTLGLKPYWYDEVFTSLWVSGYSMQEAHKVLFTGELQTVAQLQQYQTLNPNSTILDPVLLLARYDTQHPPMYYLIVRIWVTVFGSSVTSIRAISALLSLLALPLAYWLSRELFPSKTTSWLFVILMAISPVMLLYGQEAREYGLWTALILFSSAAFLKAIREPLPQNWFIYGLGLTLGLYTFPFTFFVAISHGLYLLLFQETRTKNLLIRYSLSLLTSLVLFTPWMILIFIGPARHRLRWLTEDPPWTTFIFRWILNISRAFLDFGYETYDLPILIVFTIFTASLIAYIFISAYRISTIRTYSFILLSGGVILLSLLLPDLLLGGKRSVMLRYLMPTWISLLLLTAAAFSPVLQKPDPKVNSSTAYSIKSFLLVGVILAGLVSNLIFVKADHWWNKGTNAADYHPIANIIHSFKSPLLISGDFSFLNFGKLLAISHTIDSTVGIVLFGQQEPIKIPKISEKNLLLFPSNEPIQQLEQNNYIVKPIYRENLLMEITSFENLGFKPENQ